MIEEMIKKNKTYNLFAKASTREAQKMLRNDEELLYAIHCNLTLQNGNYTQQKIDLNPFKGITNKLNGVFVITNKRIYFCNSLLFNKTKKEMAIENIESIDDSSAPFISTIRIKGITEWFVIDTKREASDEIKEKLNYAIKLNNKKETNNKFDDLEKLKKLFDEGAITQEEYNIEKKKILN